MSRPSPPTLLTRPSPVTTAPNARVSKRGHLSPFQLLSPGDQCRLTQTLERAQHDTATYDCAAYLMEYGDDSLRALRSLSARLVGHRLDHHASRYLDVRR